MLPACPVSCSAPLLRGVFAWRRCTTARRSLPRDGLCLGQTVAQVYAGGAGGGGVVKEIPEKSRPCRTGPC